MNCKKFGELTITEVQAVLQLTYQLIASANFNHISEADNPSIDIMMEKLGFTDVAMNLIGNAMWNEAMEINPFVAFDIVSKFSNTKKAAFKEAILAVARKDNTMLRMDIARQIFTRTKID